MDEPSELQKWMNTTTTVLTAQARDIAALKAFIHATYNRPELGQSKHRKNEKMFVQAQAAWDRLFPKPGIVKRAEADRHRG